jgi:hypothetical protein
MGTLLSHLPLPEKRADIVTACRELLEAEVGRKSGLSGFAIKAGYKTLKAIKPGVVTEAIDGLLDDFLEALEELHAEHAAAPAGTFGARMKQQAARVAEALVRVTDRRAEKSRHGTLRGMYHKLRPSALRHVEEAVPGLADLMDRFYRS